MKKCILCPETRALQRCHIIPRRLFEPKGVNADLYGYKGGNIVIMCPTHHKLYDHFQLNRRERRLLIQHIESSLPMLNRVTDDWKCKSREELHRRLVQWYQWFPKFKSMYG